ncbi:glycerophosphocholine cholinephosphodiesterase ENPP6 [Folsomia candida]|uniref:Ectonucleotide pyrophosphatase/phosphodiesterase family member 6 n=1 Tax=Folsomia candida TaxID=158441 RepID=A0A226E0Y6_FOLCA|nr:glycerophosphocholine cholinephosphodiesterase ENPP6 [Folsomia candida]OXA50136.1 Ectonucleotide pyrophosphatase/phosphodiesterase family member 6 [Folsomia candida]
MEAPRRERISYKKYKNSLLTLVSNLSIAILLFQFPLTDAYSHIRASDQLDDSADTGASALNNNNKLLIILIDGFRWDYYTRQKAKLPGFSQLISDGTHAEWVEPMFPSLSYPTWTTIATGLYPEEHKILGNYMLHRPSPIDTTTNDELSTIPETVFSLLNDSTKLPFWWKFVEQIWTTVTKAGRKVSLANWARCDVPFNGILPEVCTGYVYQDVNTHFRDDLLNALKRLQNGFSLAMVYDDLIDHVGHKFGPDSNELKLTLVHRDAQIRELLMAIQMSGMANKINVIITSDHGMTSLDKTVKRIYLEEFVNMGDVHRVVDYGTVVSIAAEKDRSAALAQSLAAIPSAGVLVYSKDDIPEELHYKRGTFALDFLLVAKPGYFIVGVKGEKQIPNDEKSSSAQPYAGVHGYFNMTDMRTVFFAKGPAFKKGKIQPPFRVVDQYQIFMKVLGLSPNRHHGNWDSVKDMLVA